MLKQWYTKLFIVFALVAMLVGCSANAGNQPQKKETQKKLSAVEVLHKADEAMNKVKGFSIHIAGKQKFSMSPAEPPLNQLELAFDMDVEGDTKGESAHVKGNASFFGMKMPLHMYVSNAEMYQEINGKWYKYPAMGRPEMMPTVQKNDPKKDLDLYVMISKEAPQALKLKEENGSYVLEIDSKALSQKAQQKLLERLQQEINGTALPKEPKQIQPVLKLLDFTEKIEIDKATFLPKDQKLNGKMELSDPQSKEKGSVEIQFDVQYKNMLDKPVTVPEDLKKNAKDITKLSEKEMEELFGSMFGGMSGQIKMGTNP